MIGDISDFVRRLRDMLPRGWFSETAPITTSLLSALSGAWQFVYGLIATVTALTRINTSSGSFLDAISSDFFFNYLPRRTSEIDADFIIRIKQELFRSRGTRSALMTMLAELTGNRPSVFEPAYPPDTGGYSVGGVGYNVGGGYGNLMLSHTCFVTALRPSGQGIANLAGYDTGGLVAYGSLSMVSSPVSDLDISMATAAVLPLGCTAWLSIK